MKRLSIILSFSLLLLVGCAGNSNEEATSNFSEGVEPTEETINKPNEVQESNTEDATEVSSETGDNLYENSEGNEDEKEENPLAQYSSEEIEFARVWLQLGPNKEIDGLYVRLIPAGTPLNPDDETSLNYPEDVI